MRRTILSAYLLIGLVAAMPQTTLAQAANPEPGVIHACVAISNGQVRIVAVDGVCRNGEIPAHWSITGPPGPPGPQGLPGPQGPPAKNPDPPCFDNVNRYVDCGNGTVTDTVTGLVWLKHNPFRALDYAGANQWAAALADGQEGLTDGSKAGDWRLPTKAEWETTMARATQMGCATKWPFITLTNDAGTGCWGDGPSSLSGGGGNYMWTSTTFEGPPLSGSPLGAWTVWINGGSEGTWAVDRKADGAWFTSPAVRVRGR